MLSAISAFVPILASLWYNVSGGWLHKSAQIWVASYYWLTSSKGF